MTTNRQPIIKIEHLNVTYFPGRANEVRALKDINLEFYQGEFIIFFGPSGCGKSTLLYSIAGLERNTEGDIYVKGNNLSTMRMRSLEEFHQSVIGMIFQSFYLIASLTVRQNVILPQMALKTTAAERIAKANQLLEKFGVIKQADKLPTELSGGQQQRVAICRSLMNDPDILIADEPVGNLDSKSSQDVMDLLRHLNYDDKKTVILVTHDPSHLRHAHRIFYLRDGVITGMKENTEEERHMQPTDSQSPLTVSTLSHWARAYAPTTEESAAALSKIAQSQKILAEVMTGLTVEELAHVQETIQHSLENNVIDEDAIWEYLHGSTKEGGIGMNIRKAQRIAQEITKFIELILRKKRPFARSKADSEEHDDALPLTAIEARAIRRTILQELDLNLPGLEAVQNMDETIRLRLEGTYDMRMVQKRFDDDVREGGGGMDARIARKAARMLEPFVTYVATQTGTKSIPTEADSPTPNAS
jgi:putative ABC transport system ATP-binding protein